MLDVGMRREIPLVLQAAHNAIVYVLTGDVVARAAGHQKKVYGEHALALRGGGGRVTFEALAPSHLLILAGAEISDPVVTQVPFIMNEPSQIEDAIARYRSGAMGHLALLSDS